MTVKDQLHKILDNWLIIVLVLCLLVVPGLFSSMGSLVMKSAESYGGAYDATNYQKSYSSGSGYAPSPAYYNNRDFAPDETDRKILKTVSLATETERGKYKEEEARLKDIIKESKSFLLNENVNKYGEEGKTYYVGSYSIKVPVNRYDSVVSQLKDIGKVKSFSENNLDITGQYGNAKIELEAERSRLERYNLLLSRATSVSDQLTISDRIFDQERQVKYMEDQMTTMDETIEYSTVSFYMSEKQPDFANIVFVKFSELVNYMVQSFNALLSIAFILVPWLVLGGLGFLIVRLVRKK